MVYLLKRLIVMGMCVASLLAVMVSPAPAAGPSVRVAILRDGDSVRNSQNVELLKNEIREIVSDEFDLSFASGPALSGDWSVAGVEKAARKLLLDPDVDLIIGFGVISSSVLVRAPVLDKAVIAPFVIDPLLEGLKVEEDRSGRKNLSYLRMDRSVFDDIRLFRRVAPFKRLAFVVDPGIYEALSQLEKAFAKLGLAVGADIRIIPAKERAEEVFDALDPEVDAVITGPLLRFSNSEFDRMVSGLNGRKLPTFSVFGRRDVQAGILSGASPKNLVTRIARRVALNTQQILLGRKPETLKVDFSPGEHLLINMDTARKIGFSPTYDVMGKAELINEKEMEIKRVLTLSSVMREAAASNLDIASGIKRVETAGYDVKRARAALIPQVKAETSGIIMDENRAESSFNRESERTWNGTVSATQVLYSDKAWAAYTSLKHVESSSRERYRAEIMDVSLETATIYLNVLRSETLERVRKNSLKLAKANLDRARVRRSVGIAGPSEVYRWESEIANIRKDLLKAQAGVRQAKNALNRVLNRPFHDAFDVTPATLSDPVIFISERRFLDFVDNPVHFEIFGDFLARTGLEASPELKQIDEALKARKRQLLSAKRAFWSPTIALKGDVTEIFDRGGFDEVADPFDETRWSVVLNASLPLFSGGGTKADYRKQKAEYEKLKIERRAATERIEERIRFTVHQAAASYSGIALSQDSEEAAKKNLDLVTDAYARGAVSIIDLLDAQNAAITAEEGADNSVYDFMVDMMTVQRAIGHIDFSQNGESGESLYLKFIDYFNQQKKRMPPDASGGSPRALRGLSEGPAGGPAGG